MVGPSGCGKSTLMRLVNGGGGGVEKNPFCFFLGGGLHIPQRAT